MIDFACKRFELTEVIKCGLGLTKSDWIILEFLMKNRKKVTSYELAESLNIDVSTAQRSLKRLSEKSLVIRSQTNLLSGGYYYSYEINNKNEIRKMILKVIHGWVGKVELELNKW